jgi:hypothetical protein
MSVDDKRSFWSKVCTLGGKELLKTASETLENFETSVEYFRDGGAFLPLSVWATQGYNVEDIREKSRPSDVRDHPVLGLTYRVRILSGGIMGERGQKRSSSAAASSSKKLKTVRGDDNIKVLADKSEEDDTESNSTPSSSENSSSSEKNRKSKKHKKGSKKDKKKAKKGKKRARVSKAEAAEQKKRDAENKKAVAANKKDAAAVIVKMEGPLAGLMVLVAKPGFSDLPAVIREPVTTTIKTWQKYMERAEQASGSDTVVGGIPSVKD